jgi:hypothetical protein
MNTDAKYKWNLRYIDKFLLKYKDDFQNRNLEIIAKRSLNIATDAFDKIWHF